MKQLLKKNWTAFAAGVKAQYPGRDSNLKCQYIEGEFVDQTTSPFVLPVKNYIHQKKYADAVVVVESYLHKRIFTERGLPLYSVAASEFANDFGDDHSAVAENERLLENYAQWYSERPHCPYAAASYARGLQFTGHSHRGTDWAHKVKPHQWHAMQEYNEKAQVVYNASRPVFQNHWYWTKNYFSFVLTSGVDSPEIWRRFEKAIATNPYDHDIYTKMAYMMLPRWHGSFEDVEAVAHKAVKVTEKNCGNMMYARVISSLLEYHDLPELTFDWDKLRVGFQDWLNQFPSDYVKTMFASCAYTMGDYGLTLRLLESLDRCYIDAWDADQAVYLANSVCREFVKKHEL